MTTPYLRWREKHVSFYELLGGDYELEKYRAILTKIRPHFALQLGLHSRKVKVRKISGHVAIYVTKSDFALRRRDNFIMFPDVGSYANYLYGLIIGFRISNT